MKDSEEWNDGFSIPKSNIQLQNKDHNLQGLEFQVHQN